MKKLIMLALCVLVFVSLAVAQNPTYTEGNGMHGIDKLGAHQNGGRGCVGCHAPHSGARGNGGNAATGAGPVTDTESGNLALWGQDLSPLYSYTVATGADGSYDVTLPANQEPATASDENQITGIMMCLSCHDGNIAKGAMMTNQAYEQRIGVLPAGYGTQPIPTLLGADGTAAGNYKNDHPIGPKATLGAVGVASRLILSTCGTPATPCLLPDTTNTAYMTFISHYGAFNTTIKTTANPSGGRVNVVIPTGATSPASAYLVCTTCHTPHSMYPFSGSVRGQVLPSGQNGIYPTYFFITAPYNPGAPVTNGTLASSATQFCRQCHFTGAGGSNEGSGIMNVDTSF